MSVGRWFGLALCAILASCGVSGATKSERVSEQRAELALPPQISADFPVDHTVLDFDPNAKLLSVAASATGGYLLSYYVVHQAESWSRIDVVQHVPSNVWAEFVFLHWDPTGGAATTLARFPSASLSDQAVSARAIEVDEGWLIVYEDRGPGPARRARILANDGSLGAPKELPLSACQLSTGQLGGFARGGSTALLTDICGTGLLLDLTGGVLASLTLATPSAFASPPIAGRVGGGQVAFNGIGYLAMYAFQADLGPTSSGRQALAFPITETGAIAPPIVLANPRTQPGFAGVVPVGMVANGNAFLALLSQPRGSEHDFSYRVLTEATDHTFALADERYLPGGPGANDQVPSDRRATALVLNGHFAIARLPNTGALGLVFPSSIPGSQDTSQSLAGAMGADIHASPPLVVASGARLLVASDTQAVRYDDTLHLIDDPPATLLWAQHGQFMPSLAFSGSRYLATWTEGIPNGLGYTGSESADTFAQHVSSLGAILDPVSLHLSPARELHEDPWVIANSAWFAVQWSVGYGNGGITLSTAEPPVLTPFQAPSGISHVWSIGTDGQHLVTAFDNHYDIAFMQQAVDGTFPLATTVASGMADETVTRPALAFNAGNHAVLWTVAGDPGERVIYGARVSANQVLLDDPPKELLHFSSPDIPGHPGHPADCGLVLIASGDHFLVAWADVAGNVEELRVARLSNTLALLDPGGILVATQPYPLTAFNTRRVALGWDGSFDWVVWVDGEGGARSPFASLRGRRFLDNLSPADAEPFLIASDMDEMSKVTLAVGDGGRSLVGYTRHVASDFSFRVRARFLSSTPFADGVPCSGAAQCQSGHCAASVCSPMGGSGGSTTGGSGGIADGGNGAGGVAAAAGGNAGNGDGIGGTVIASGNTGGDGAGGVSTTVGGDTSNGGAVSGGASSGGSETGTGGALAGGFATGGDTSGGTAGTVATGGTFGGGGIAGSVDGNDAGSVAVAGEGGGADVSVGGEEGSEAGASVGGARSSGGSGTSGARAGHAGMAGAMADTGGSKHHSCSVSRAGVPSTNANFAAIAGLASALCLIRRRRARRERESELANA